MIVVDDKVAIVGGGLFVVLVLALFEIEFVVGGGLEVAQVDRLGRSAVAVAQLP
jgi:hypothetical protein